jgi:hypothetical protein
MLIVITISVDFHMGFHFTISRHLQSETNDNKREQAAPNQNKANGSTQQQTETQGSQ